MVSIFELLKEEKEKIDELNELELKIVQKKIDRDTYEAFLWTSLNFKELGATNDSMRRAVVTQTLHKELMPIYENLKAKIKTLKNEIDFINQTISVMKEFGVQEIELEEKEEDKDEESSS